MQSPDDKQYPLAKATRRPQSGRSVSKKDFTLPKPYRRQLYSEEPERLTRLQLSLLGFAGVMVSTLIGVLALMAHESERSPDGKLIVAAAKLEPVAHVDQAEAQFTAFAAPVAKPEPEPRPPLRRSVKVPALPAPQPANRLQSTLKPFKITPLEKVVRMPAKPTQHARITAALLGRDTKVKPLRTHLAVPAPAPDPDVALITAILLLTPQPAPASAPSISMELAGRGQTVCVATAPKENNCHDLHKMKP